MLRCAYIACLVYRCSWEYLSLRQKEKRSNKFFLHHMHSSRDIVAMMCAARNVIWARHAERNVNADRVLMLKFQAKESFRRPKFVGGLY